MAKNSFVGSMEAPSKVFLLFSMLPDSLKLNHLKSRMECGFSDIFSRHFCSTVAETIGVTINPASFGAKKCSENHIWSCWDDSWSMEPTSLRRSKTHNSTDPCLLICQVHPLGYFITKYKCISSFIPGLEDVITTFTYDVWLQCYFISIDSWRKGKDLCDI